MYCQQRFNRENPDAALEKIITELFEENNGNYGYRRIQIALNERGLKGAKFTRKSRKYYSYKGTVGKVAKNRIHRRFYTSVPHQKITTDTSEFKYFERDNTGGSSHQKTEP